MATPILGTAIPQLPSGDLGVTAKFFRERLGFTEFELHADHGHLIARRGATEIHFWDAGSAEAAKEIGCASSCYVRGRDVARLYAELQERDVTFAYELTLQPWGMHEMQVNDPFGNAIRFGEALGPQDASSRSD